MENDIRQAFDPAVKMIIEKLPDGWAKHNALCKIQEAVWWSLKTLEDQKAKK